LFQAAWALLLARYCGTHDVLFGLVVSGRQAPIAGIETICGLIASTLPQRVEIGSGASVRSWLGQVQRRTAEAREYEHTPHRLIEDCSEVPAEELPLFESVVVIAPYRGSDFSAAEHGISVSEFEFFTQPHYALTLFVTFDDHVRVRLVYERKRYDHSTAERLLAEYKDLVRAIVEGIDKPVESLLS